MFYNDAHYLVTDNGAALAGDDARLACLGLLEKSKKDLGLKIPAYALLPDRALIYFVTPGVDLKAFMAGLSRPFAGWRAGCCKYKLLQPEKFAAHLARFIHKEPVKAGLAANPEEYKWSSAAQYLGGEGLADKDVVLKYFPGDSAEALCKYKAFMAETVPGKFWRPFDKNRDAVVGDDSFQALHSPHHK